MAPEIEAATALLEEWDGNLEELAWVAELLDRIEPDAVSEVAALAREVCRRARTKGDASEIAKLERAIELASRVA